MYCRHRHRHLQRHHHRHSVWVYRSDVCLAAVVHNAVVLHLHGDDLHDHSTTPRTRTELLTKMATSGTGLLLERPCGLTVVERLS
jgi:hypothetical protein